MLKSIIKNIAERVFGANIFVFERPISNIVESFWSCSLGKSEDSLDLYVWGNNGLHKSNDLLRVSETPEQYDPSDSSLAWYPKIFDSRVLPKGRYLLMRFYDNGSWNSNRIVENIAYIFEV